MSWFTSWFSGQENNGSGVGAESTTNQVIEISKEEKPEISNEERAELPKEEKPETSNENEKNQQAAAIPINIPVIPLTATEDESNILMAQAEAETTDASEQQPMNTVETETKEMPLEETKKQPDVELVVFQPELQPESKGQSNSSCESELPMPKLERESFSWPSSMIPIPFVTIDVDVKTKKAPLASSTQALEIMLLKKETDRLTRNLNHSRLLYQQLSEKFSAKTSKSDKMHDALLKQIVELRAENESLRKLVPKEKHLTQPKHKVIKTKQQRKAEAKKMRYNLQERSRAKMMDEQEHDEDDDE